MRVVAGSAGGVPLEAPRGDLVRPTMDRVKAAIFSSLGEKIPDARVLDLFAGSGALGIEALSRGSKSVVFVESDRRAVESIQRNLAKTRLDGVVRCGDVFDFLERANPESFDIIFADPPYAKTSGARDFDTELLRSPALARALAHDGIFVLEKMPGENIPLGETWECVRLKKYGSTEVAFLRWNSAVAKTETHDPKL
jgi:16S rRNA (guanine966-N2)-methyltransferase